VFLTAGTPATIFHIFDCWHHSKKFFASQYTLVSRREKTCVLRREKTIFLSKKSGGFRTHDLSVARGNSPNTLLSFHSNKGKGFCTKEYSREDVLLDLEFFRVNFFVWTNFGESELWGGPTILI